MVKTLAEILKTENVVCSSYIQRCNAVLQLKGLYETRLTGDDAVVPDVIVFQIEPQIDEKPAAVIGGLG